LTPAGDIRPSEALRGKLVKTAWNFHQNPLLTQLKKCCVSSDINGTEDDSQWEEDYEEKYATSDESVGWG